MSWLMGNSKFKNTTLVFGFLALIIGILFILYYNDFLENPKWGAVISGLLTGFVVALFQAWLSIRELRKMDRYDKLEIVEILATRDDPNYYRPLVAKAKKEIQILGVTCLRFLEDFANTESTAPEGNKVLLAALRNSELVVKILVAKEDHLTGDDKNKAIAARPKLEELSKTFPNRFHYAFYDQVPTHSIMVVDDECLVGPVFPGVPSKFSPAVHLKNESKFVVRYLAYFEQEWNTWSSPRKD